MPVGRNHIFSKTTYLATVEYSNIRSRILRIEVYEDGTYRVKDNSAGRTLHSAVESTESAEAEKHAELVKKCAYPKLLYFDKRTDECAFVFHFMEGEKLSRLPDEVKKEVVRVGRSGYSKIYAEYFKNKNAVAIFAPYRWKTRCLAFTTPMRVVVNTSSDNLFMGEDEPLPTDVTFTTVDISVCAVVPRSASQDKIKLHVEKLDY